MLALPSRRHCVHGQSAIRHVRLASVAALRKLSTAAAAWHELEDGLRYRLSADVVSGTETIEVEHVSSQAYGGPNASVIMLAQSLADWLAPYNVTCNAVCPGLTDTSRMDDLGYPRGSAWNQSTQSNPLGRAATDDEIAGVIAFLCSNAASYISGQAINVNGGSVTW